jgi:phosphate starvation-inducible membrane PsiE
VEVQVDQVVEVQVGTTALIRLVLVDPVFKVKVIMVEEVIQ